MASPSAQKKFERDVRAALVKLDEITNYALEMIQVQIKEYRADILATIVPKSAWQAHRLQDLDAALDQARLSAYRKMAGTWAESSAKATALALASVDGPLSAIGIPAKFIPQMIPVQQLAILDLYVPGLIADVTTDVHKRVRNLMRQAMLGGAGPDSIMKQIGDVVGPLRAGQRPPGTVFASADVRARTILRTEMNRLHNLAKTQRVAAMAEKYPGIGYKWLHRSSPNPRASHSALHGTIIFPAAGETFSVGQYQAAGPHDPGLPAEHTINCHCTAVVVYDKDRGAQGAKDSPYIAGDGTNIPSAGV